MRRQPILMFMKCIKQLKRPIFSTHEVADISGKTVSATTQALNVLEMEGFVFKIYRGLWAEAGSVEISPYKVVPYLFPRQRAYVSFLSAMHLYGMIEQIPQMVTLASIVHTRVIRTKIGAFSVHRISPRFFDGFVWYKGSGSFLIAEAEKALVDSLYLSGCKKKQFRYFPELSFPKSFSFRKARGWVRKIPDLRIRSYVERAFGRLSELVKGGR